MGFQWGPTDDRGISEIYGTILIISLVFVTAIALVGVGFFVLNDTTGNANDRLAQDSILELDDRLNELGADQADNSITWEIPEGTGDDFAVESDAGKVNITVATKKRYWNAGHEEGALVDLDGSSRVNATEITLGTIIHEGDDGVKTVYQGGGVLEIQSGSVTVLREPNIEATNETLNLNLFDLSSLGDIGEGQEVELSQAADPAETSSVQQMIDEAMRNDGEIVAPAEINMVVTTEYAEAWETFAKERGFKTYDTGEPDQVGIEFGEFGTGVDLPPDPNDPYGDDVIYSGTADLAPELHDPDEGKITEPSSDRFRVDDPSGYSVGIHVPTSETDGDAEWWTYNEALGSDGKWENIERANEEVAPKTAGFPDVNSDTFEVGDDRIVCVVDGDSDDLRSAVESEGDGCLEHSVGGNETALEADFQPYLEVSGIVTSPSVGSRLIRDGSPGNVTTEIEVRNIGPGDATNEPVGAFINDNDVGEFVRVGAEVDVNKGNSKTAIADKIDPGFLLFAQDSDTTTFNVGGATAYDREVRGGWVLSNSSVPSDVKIEEFTVDNSTVTAGETISGDVVFNNTGGSSITVSALLGAGPNNEGVRASSIPPNSEKTVDFDLNTDRGSAEFSKINVTIPGNGEPATNESLTVLEPDTTAEFVVTDTDLKTPTTVSTGDKVKINATVKNKGGVSGIQPIQFATVDDDGNIDGTVAVEGAVELDPDESREVQLTWQTTARDIGTYNVSVFTADDNSSTKSVEIDPAPDTDAEFDVEVLDTNEPVTASERLEVEINVTNVGAEGAEKYVWLTEKGKFATFNRTSLYLPPGDSKNATLYWDTSRDDADDHTVVAETQDDSDDKKVTIEPPGAEADLEIIDLVRDDPSDGTMIAGGQANVTATIRNPDDDFSGSGLVILENINDSVADTVETDLLGPGKTTRVGLNWTTFPGDEGEGELTARIDGTENKTDLEVEPQRGDREPLDVAFVHDESGSMGNQTDLFGNVIIGSDPSGERIDVTKEFVGSLNDSKDRVGYVRFNATADIPQNLTRNFDQLNNSLSTVASGGTNIARGITKALDSLGVAEQTDTRYGPGETFTVRSGERAIVSPANRDGDYEESYLAEPGDTVSLGEDCESVFGITVCTDDRADIYEVDEDFGRNKNIVLLGDGKHQQGNPQPRTAAALADLLDVTIYTVGLGDDLKGTDSEGRETLRQNVTKPENYFYAENASQLSEKFESIQAEVITVENPKLQATITNSSLAETNLGEDVTVEVDVTNTGNVSGDRPIWLVEEFSGTPVASTTVNLTAGADETVTLTWEDIEVAESEFNSESPPNATSNLTVRTANSADSTELTVTDKPSFFDVTSVNHINPSGDPIPPDGEVKIKTTVENTKSGFDKQNVYLRAPWGAPVDSESIELSDGSDNSMTLAWDLSTVNLTRSNLSVDITTDDDNATVSDIELEETATTIPDYEIERIWSNANATADDSIEAGEDLVVTAAIRNVGSTTAEQFVQLQDFDGNTVDVEPVTVSSGTQNVTLAWNTTLFDDSIDDITVAPTKGTPASQTVNITKYDPDAEFDMNIIGTNATEGDGVTGDSITAGKETLEVEVKVTNSGERDRAIVELNDADEPDRLTTLRDFGMINNGSSETRTIRYRTNPDDHKIEEITASIERYNVNKTTDVNITENDFASDVKIKNVTSTAATRAENVTAGSGTITVTVNFEGDGKPEDGNVVSLYEGSRVESENLLNFEEASGGEDSLTIDWQPMPGDGDNLRPRKVTMSVQGEKETIEVYINPAPDDSTDMPDGSREPVGIDVDEIQAS